MAATVDTERRFTCPADGCRFSVVSDDIDEVVVLAKDHALDDHGEHLQRKTVLWQMRMGRARR